MEGSSVVERISPETPEISGQQQPRSLEEEWKELEAQKRELEAQKLGLEAVARELEEASRALLADSKRLTGEMREFHALQRKSLIISNVFSLILLCMLCYLVTILNNLNGMLDRMVNSNCTCTMPNNTEQVEAQIVPSNYTYEEDPFDDPLTKQWMGY